MSFELLLGTYLLYYTFVLCGANLSNNVSKFKVWLFHRNMTKNKHLIIDQLIIGINSYIYLFKKISASLW